MVPKLQQPPMLRQVWEGTPQRQAVLLVRPQVALCETQLQHQLVTVLLRLLIQQERQELLVQQESQELQMRENQELLI